MLASLLFAALCAPAANAAPVAALGPPSLCHAFDIGDARSLPWGQGAAAARADYDVGNLPQDTYDILYRSDDPLVHAETLRRAAIYLTGVIGDRKGPNAELREELIQDLMDELEFDADVHGAAAKAACEKSKAACDKPCPPSTAPQHLLTPLAPAWGGRVCQAQSRDPALCFLDVGYLRAALREAGAARKDDGTQSLRTAMLLKTDDLSLQLAASLGLLDHPDAAARAEGWKNVDSVARKAENAPGRERLEKNLLATIGPIVSAKTHDELVARLHQRAEQG